MDSKAQAFLISDFDMKCKINANCKPDMWSWI